MSTHRYAGLHPIDIQEIGEVDEHDALAQAEAERVEVPYVILEQIKVKVKKLEKFDEVWRSAGIATKHKSSIWEDRLSASRKMVGGRNRTRINLGHFGSGSYAAPKNDRYTLELTDLTLNGVQQSRWAAVEGGKKGKPCLDRPQTVC
jgi:hypothetical protein